MHLKTIEIVGFKSFADRCKLDLEPGITAIVGPNGCGKSNIIDAIRWCLGEMSVKSLRSNLMMDVVFNGSGARPPQHMAEVTLTFDNSDKRLPIDFTDVSIARRLFRSGESEYYINKTECRLKDVRELFLDTGMGEDGYSSMEQGKVEWILQAKPEDRRELFEEAAGVSKYRARREEAIRKLDRIEIDLSRLTDIILVTKEQIKRLESAVTRAKTYQRVREELKILEISDWLAQLGNVEEELNGLKSRLTNAQTEAESLSTQIHQHDVALSELRVGLTQTEEELLQANQALNGIDADIKITEERVNNFIQRQKELSAQMQNLNESMGHDQNRIVELSAQSDEQKKTFQEVKQDGSSIESDYETSQSLYDEGLEKLGVKQQNIKELRDLILTRAQERAQIQQQISYLTSDEARFELQDQSHRKEINRCELEREELIHSKVEIDKQMDIFKTQLGEKSAFLEKLNSQIEKFNSKEVSLRSQILTLSEEIAGTKGRIHSLQLEQTQDPYLSGVQSALSQGFPGIQGPLGRLIQSAKTDKDIIHSTLGEHLNDLVAETSEDAERVIEYLARHEKGRVRLWVLNKLPGVENAGRFQNISGSDRLIDRIKCEDRIKPLISFLCAPYLISGSNVYGTAFINGGMDPSRWKTQVHHNLPDWEEQLIQKNKTKDELESLLITATQKHINIKAEREQTLKELEEVRIRLELAKEDQENLAKKTELVEEELSVARLELEQIKIDKAKSYQSLNEKRERFEQIHQQEGLDHKHLDELHHDLAELQIVHANTNADLTSKKDKHNAFVEKLSWQTSILNHTLKELSDIDRRMAFNKTQVSQMAEEIATTQRNESQSKEWIETSLKKRQEASAVCSGIHLKRVELAEKIQTLETELQKKRHEMDSLHETIQNEKISETSLTSRSQSLLQKLTDQYELSLETAKAEFLPQLADPENLDKLKKRVANMGPINLEAPQEHAELSVKHNFLDGQYNDLLKAKDDLRQVITKINATTREHFKETFDKVRENFRNLYSQLFQGGEADLRLTDESDILNAGVDIYCQPPGKKLLHISLLSGGEKALTACALLFAFFQVRPSPVALLDEVDAPLDEANILRYVEILKIFSEKSQFFLISHNKRTMEAANTLYGVTMEEFGVSKVLSARLHKEKKKIEASLESEPAVA